MLPVSITFHTRFDTKRIVIEKNYSYSKTYIFNDIIKRKYNQSAIVFIILEDSMLRIAVCEDEAFQTQLLVKYINEWAAINELSMHVECYENASSFLFQWEDKPSVDVLLLDIEMPGPMNGMELAKTLRSQKDNVQIIFVTGVTDFVCEGYSVDAVSYIIKPVKKEKLFECLDKAHERCTREGRYIIVEEPGMVRKVSIRDICYIESTGHDTSICTIDGSFRCKKNIGDMEEELKEESFIKIHRSYLVNVERIQRITKKEVVVDGGQAIPIARGKWESVNLACLKFYRS